MKGWWSEGQFRSNPLTIEWRTSKFRKSVQIIEILMEKRFGRKDASRFLEQWIPIIHQAITYGSILNWGEIISSNLDIQLKKVQKKHQFYMSLYILYVMCASREYPYLSWRWKPNLLSIHVYYKMLWENKYNEDYQWISNDLFSPIYWVLFGKEEPRLSLEGKKYFKSIWRLVQDPWWSLH